jgi:hypothetical protein
MSANGNTQNVQFDPATLGQGMPAPTGTDDNGQPYWIIDGQKIVWAQMQQILWQQRQSQSMAGGGGFESAPTMINIPNMPTGVEAAPEKGPNLQPERSLESRAENKAETRVETAKPQSGNTKPAPQTKKKAQKVIGDSPKLVNIDVEDVEDLHRYYKQTEDNASDAGKSNSYLTALVGKILRQLASTSK